MSTEELTNAQCEALGQRLRNEDNLVIGSFAAEMIGESYPVSKSMQEIIFRDHTNAMLGRKFAEWIDAGEKK